MLQTLKLKSKKMEKFGRIDSRQMYSVIIICLDVDEKQL